MKMNSAPLEFQMLKLPKSLTLDYCGWAVVYEVSRYLCKMFCQTTKLGAETLERTHYSDSGYCLLVLQSMTAIILVTANSDISFDTILGSRMTDSNALL